MANKKGPNFKVATREDAERLHYILFEMGPDERFEPRNRAELAVARALNLMDSGEPSECVAGTKTILAYSYGLPTQRTDISVNTNISVLSARIDSAEIAAIQAAASSFLSAAPPPVDEPLTIPRLNGQNGQHHNGHHPPPPPDEDGDDV